ncbi:MAG: hypothetical protein QNI84_08090 [Henriciella sp.]|nr:hypothetical protein [Henriciella sp.]
MTVKRAPNSLEDAIARACAPLGGVTNAALLIGKSNRYVLADAANPNKPDGIRLDDAIKLDIACMDQGGGTPLRDFYDSRLEVGEAPRAALLSHLSGLTEAFGGTLSEVTKSAEDGALTPAERDKCLAALVKMQDRLRAFVSDMESRGRP